MNCRFSWTVTTLIILILPLKSVYSSSENQIFTQMPTLIIGQGEQRLLQIPEIQRFSFGGNVTKSIPLPHGLNSHPHTLLIKGVHSGFGDLWVWKKDGKVEHRTLQVVPWQKESLPTPLQRALEPLQEVEILPAGTQVLIRGLIHSISEAARVSILERSFTKEVINETELSPDLVQKAEVKIQDWISRSPYSSKIHLENKSQTLWVKGYLEFPLERQSVEKQIRALFPLVNFTLDTLPDQNPTIYFRVFLLEIKKDQFKSLGFQWPAALENAFHVTPSSIQGALQFDLGLQALARNGLAKILSKPELAVRAPGEAELFSGGELPIHTKTKSSSNVLWKTFGLTLKLKVEQATAAKIRLEIFTEVSSLDSNIASDQVPGLRTNRMKTQVDAEMGRPLMLSGLLQENIRKQARGIPMLRNIPVFGALFGSEDYLHEQTELVAVLLPHSLAPTNQDSSTESSGFPKGPIPVPRNWISMEKQKKLKTKGEYPWNAFDE